MYRLLKSSDRPRIRCNHTERKLKRRRMNRPRELEWPITAAVSALRIAPQKKTLPGLISTLIRPKILKFLVDLRNSCFNNINAFRGYSAKRKASSQRVTSPAAGYRDPHDNQEHNSNSRKPKVHTQIAVVLLHTA